MTTLTLEEKTAIIAMIEGDTSLPDEIKAGIVASYKSITTPEEKAGIIAVMARRMPACVKESGNAEALARCAYAHFRKHYVYDLVDKFTTPVPVWFAEALAPIAAAGADLREGIDTMGEDVGTRLRDRFMARGANLDVLRLSLQVLAEVVADVDATAAICSPKPKETRGSKKKDTTRAAVETVRYLMQHTQDRNPAAVVVEAMLDADPSITPKISCKTLVGACRSAGVGNREQKPATKTTKKKSANKT